MNFRRWQAFAVGVLFLILAGLISLTSDPRSVATGPEVVLREVVAPVQTVFATVSRWGRELFLTLDSFGELREENMRLRQEVAALQAQVREYEQLGRENERLREILGLRMRLPYTTVVAQVVARSAEHWFSTATINRGSDDGLRPGLAVINAQGVVGHVESVTPNTARVLLLTDPKSAIGGMIEGSEIPVLVEGTSDPSGRRAIVRPLVHGAPLKPGDTVVTSGLSQIFPRGLLIGTVESASEVGPELRVQGVLRPAVDFGWLDWVVVIVDPEGAP